MARWQLQMRMIIWPDASSLAATVDGAGDGRCACSGRPAVCVRSSCCSCGDGDGDCDGDGEHEGDPLATITTHHPDYPSFLLL